MKEIVLKNFRTRLSKPASEHNIMYATIQYIPVETMGMRQIAARLFPYDLTIVQKHHRKTFSEDLISEAKNDSTIKKWIITDNETWV